MLTDNIAAPARGAHPSLVRLGWTSALGVIVVALCTAACLVSAAPAAAATGPTVSNDYFSVYVTTSCSAGRIYAQANVTSKKNNLYVEWDSAGLYSSTGRLVTSTGLQGYNYPVTGRSTYAGAKFSFVWSANAPRGGATLKFFIDTPKTAVVSVPAGCTT